MSDNPSTIPDERDYVTCEYCDRSYPAEQTKRISVRYMDSHNEQEVSTVVMCGGCQALERGYCK